MKMRPALLLLGLIPATLRLSPAGAAQEAETPPAAAVPGPASPAPGASNPAPLSAAALLDQAIGWPGDFERIFRGRQRIWSFEEPPFPAYGTASRQACCLSKSRIAELNGQRAAIAAEILKRLKAFDWKHFPPAPAPAPEITGLLKNERARLPSDGPHPKPRKPENSMALGAAMLRIIEATEAVETLPELLRLEEELNILNKTALKARAENAGYFNHPLGPVPRLYVPPIETADPLGDFKSTAEEKTPASPTDDRKPPEAKLAEAWTKWESQVFANLVFQREIIGVSPGLLERKSYAPLRQSLSGRLTALGRRHEGLKRRDGAGSRDALELTEEQRRPELKPDADSRLPRSVDSIVLIPFDKTIRQEARQLIQAFVSGGAAPSLPEGAAILEQAIGEPGDFSQMCAPGLTLPFPLPLPASASLTFRHFNLSEETIRRLQASRDSVIPVITERLKSLKLETPPPKPPNANPYEHSGQDSRSFGPLLVQVLECLNAVEALPDLLRLEQQLRDLVAKAQSDPAFAPPNLPVDAPAVRMALDPSDESPEGNKKRDRAEALLSCGIYQREILGLISVILENENDAPFQSSLLVRERRKGLDKLASNVPSEEALMNFQGLITSSLVWDREAKTARVKEGGRLDIAVPFTPALRDEIRSMADAYLKTTPPDKRKAGDGMVLSWFPPQP